MNKTNTHAHARTHAHTLLKEQYKSYVRQEEAHKYCFKGHLLENTKKEKNQIYSFIMSKLLQQKSINLQEICPTTVGFRRFFRQ